MEDGAQHRELQASADDDGNEEISAGGGEDEEKQREWDGGGPAVKEAREKQIEPTHTCFDDALELMNDMMNGHREHEHCFCQPGPGTGDVKCCKCGKVR